MLSKAFFGNHSLQEKVIVVFSPNKVFSEKYIMKILKLNQHK